MRTTRHVMGGFAAGMFVAIALASMLGTRPQQAEGRVERPRISAETLALLKQIKEADDRTADAQAQLNFWQLEATVQAGEVSRLQNDATANPSLGFFLGQAQGLSCRAVNSCLDARLNVTLCARKAQALKAELAGP